MPESLESEKVDAMKEGTTKVCVILPKSLANSYLYMHAEDSVGPAKKQQMKDLKDLSRDFSYYSLQR